MRGGSRATRIGTIVFCQRYSSVLCRPLASGYLWIRLPVHRMRLLAIIISGKGVGLGGECSKGSRDSSVRGWAGSLQFNLEAFSIHLCIALAIRRETRSKGKQ